MIRTRGLVGLLYAPNAGSGEGKIAKKKSILKISKAEFGLIKELFYSSKSQNFLCYAYYFVAKEEPLVMKRKIQSQCIDCLVKMFSTDLEIAPLDCPRSHDVGTNYSIQA